MLVKMASKADKIEFMTSLRKLKGADDKFKPISVAHGLTAKQREAVKAALIEAKLDLVD